jgi:predicted NUDIX family NTP pyrophosphohydrolase
MPKRSSGLVLYRRIGSQIEVLLVHPGGPFWARRDEHAWSIPKGEYEEDEDPEHVARREFSEELGREPPTGTMVDLGEVRQSGGKLVRAWALEGDLDTSSIASNTFEMEWPPKSGKIQTFPEVDRAEWFGIETARTKLHKGQVVLMSHLEAFLA